MPRISRKSLETSFFHIITQGVNKEYIFHKEEYSEKYLYLINKYKEEYHISILAYCIMSNHTHLLLHTNNIECMSKFMHKVNGIFSQFYNKCENRVGIVFRNRFVSEPIYEERYLANCINYIHKNPIKAGLVKKCEEYKYSSFIHFKNNKNSILIDIFGKEYIQLINNINNDVLFYDIDTNKEEILDNAISRFEIIEKDTLNNILENRESLKKMIKFLKVNYKITYVDMMKRLRITRGEMNSLKK